MLNRQKALLATIAAVPEHGDHAQSVSSDREAIRATRLVKLMFLVRHETGLQQESAFYDFVPYRFGPFSFALYRELDALRRDGYVAGGGRITACEPLAPEYGIRLCDERRHDVARLTDGMPSSYRDAVSRVVGKYGRVPQTELLRDVYSRYPWYATKSELTELVPRGFSAAVSAKPAVYTAGYEGKSVDGFFDGLLRAGIRCIVDVRANPISRKYGFARKSMSDIAGRLGIQYRHLPELGIPGAYRAELSDFASYECLFDWYETNVLPHVTDSVCALGRLMQTRPSVLICMEEKPHWCHRSRLAKAVAAGSGLDVVHLGR